MAWLLAGAALAVAVMVVFRLTGLPPSGGPGLAVTSVVGAVAFLLAFPVLMGPFRMRGPVLLRTVALMVAGAALWDGTALAAAPGWYGGEASTSTAAGAVILFGAGVLLLVAVVLADRDQPRGPSVAASTGDRARSAEAPARDRVRS